MPSIILTMPDGMYIKNPEVEFIHEILQDHSKYFTSDGCGEIACEFKSNDIHTYMGVRLIEPSAFSIEWTMRKGTESSGSASIIVPRKLDQQTAVTIVGGTPLHVPLASVISCAEAYEIVKEFCESGRVDPIWNPIRLSELPANFYYWGDCPQT